MSKNIRYLLLGIIIVCIVLILAVSLHSVDEIHYFKTFYPRTFTVEEAFFATCIEFIKIHIISLPLVLIIVICLYLSWLWERGGGARRD